MVGCFPIRLDPKECAPIEVVGDPNGELVEALGMYANLGPTLGMRSKRFALVAEDGVVKHVAIDEGAEVCVKTSAQALLPRASRADPSVPHCAGAGLRGGRPSPGGRVVPARLRAAPPRAGALPHHHVQGG